MTRTKSLVVFSTLVLGLLGVHFADKIVAAQAEKDKAPAFTLKLLNGGDLKSSELEGKVTVLKFVASW
ncbi:MAG: hypothetical protein A3F90_04970 [Deltaproteobacteria bacterium RIFCSPLOWO2_12_FULL_60_19]|nr:MAG: hypothetical protein A3F90_04970 [Deltaproteobacteria bacterium RIFCSPLOWO2_12_FULL_60_19]